MKAKKTSWRVLELLRKHGLVKPLRNRGLGAFLILGLECSTTAAVVGQRQVGLVVKVKKTTLCMHMEVKGKCV